MFTTERLLKIMQNADEKRYEELISERIKNPEKFENELELYKSELEQQDETTIATNIAISKEDPKEEIKDFMIEKNQEGIKYINSYKNYEETKILTQTNFKDNGKLIFFVSKRDVMEGKLTNEVYPYKQKFKLISETTKYNNYGEEVTINFFDEKLDKRSSKISNILSANFWIYQFESHHKQYLLLSEERLELEKVTIEGMKINLDDWIPIGQSKKLNTELPIIFINKIHKHKPSFKTQKEMIKEIKHRKLNHKNYFNWLFSQNNTTFNHPDYFQYLISSFLLHSVQTYPINLIIIAKQGTGKSTLEEVIFERFDEDIEIVEGSASTLKALIPSFKGNLPNAGAILKSNRLCLVDELFRILMRVDKDDREIQLSSLNPILEHRKNRTVSSGNGTLRFNPTARVLAVTNPVWGTNSMESLCEHIDNSFLSRWLIWYQDDKHVKYIQNEQGMEDKTYDLNKEFWLGVVDFCNSFICEFDEYEVKKIYEYGLNLLGEDIPTNNMSKARDVYTARYRHHIKCLLDGIVKTRCICEGDDSFIAKEEDYLTLKKIWYRMMVEWGVYGGDFFKEGKFDGKIY